MFFVTILYKQKQLPKIHSLDRLLEICVADNKNLAVLKNDTLYLTDYYLETRYPGDYHEYSWSEAQQALQAAQRIKQLCLSCLSRDN